jgi:hypothetical protein
MLRKLREHIEKTSTYVGDRFASEARAMHVGDKDETADPRAGQPGGGEARWSRTACRSCRCRSRFRARATDAA